MFLRTISHNKRYGMWRTIWIYLLTLKSVLSSTSHSLCLKRRDSNNTNPSVSYFLEIVLSNGQLFQTVGLLSRILTQNTKYWFSEKVSLRKKRYGKTSKTLRARSVPKGEGMIQYLSGLVQLKERQRVNQQVIYLNKINQRLQLGHQPEYTFHLGGCESSSCKRRRIRNENRGQTSIIKEKLSIC